MTEFISKHATIARKSGRIQLAHVISLVSLYVDTVQPIISPLIVIIKMTPLTINVPIACLLGMTHINRRQILISQTLKTVHL